MLINAILLLTVLTAIIFLVKQLRKKVIETIILPDCVFKMGNLKYDINENLRVAKFSVHTKNVNRYFSDFPLAFKFYSEEKFRSKIRITYKISGDDETEVIYDRVVDFENTAREHIYYLNDVVLGSIDIEIITDSQYGKPTIQFEILQNNMCHISQPHKLLIKFPK